MTTFIALLVVQLLVMGILHFISHKQLVRASETKGTHLQCSFCPCIVARYRQLPDSKIQCANCQRKAEK